MSERLPVVILAGALGCGKTTVLNHLLASSGARVGVIINDFGDVNIDALLVRGQIDKPQSVAGGCLCCIADPSELDDALAALTRPDLRLDAIVIEASGVAEPRELARMVLSSTVPGIRFGGAVVLLDATTSGDVHTDAVRVATLLAFTKTDVVAVSPELERQVRACNPTAPLVHLAQGRLPAEMLFEALARPEAVGQLSLFDVVDDTEDPVDHHHHQHGHAQSVSVESPQGMCPRRLAELLQSQPTGVARTKGVTYFPTSKPGHRYVVHGVGPILTLDKGPWPPDQAPQTALVMIGADLDVPTLRARLEGCLTEGPVKADDVRNLVRFMRRAQAPASGAANPTAANQPAGS